MAAATGLFRPHGLRLGRPSCRSRHAAPQMAPRRIRAAGDELNGTPKRELDVSAQMDVDIKEIASKLLASDPKTQENLQRIQAARLRVAEAQAAKEALDQEMKADAFEARMKEVQEMQSGPQREAEAKLKLAEAALLEAQSHQIEAERDERKWMQALSEENEKGESVKAAVIAGVAGTLASIPLTLSNSDSAVVGILSTLSFSASCFLLGVVYRYALRQDLGNSQLKGGVVAAFGLVRGLAIADALQTGVDGQLTAELVAKGALLAGQSVLTFGFAAVALEFALQRGFLKAFGTASYD